MKKCLRCEKNKPLKEIAKNKNRKDGYSCYCKECIKIKSLEFRVNNPLQQMLSNTKSSAKKRGIEFTLTIDDIVIPEICPYLKIKLEFNAGNGLSPNTPSIDRINTDGGYHKDNIRIISHKANSLKSDLTIDNLILFANQILILHSKS